MGVEQKLGNLGVVTFKLEQVDQLVAQPMPCGPCCLAWHAARLK